MNPQTKPTTVPEYRSWLAKEYDIEAGSALPNYYTSVTGSAREALLHHPFWTSLGQALRQAHDRYGLNTAYPLLIDPGPPDILVKPYDSFLLKTFRKNILANDCWPDPPEGGWLLPHRWLERVNDVLRTQFVVKYLDGVDALCTCLRQLAESHSVYSHLDFEARDDGYYAAHLYIKTPLEVPAYNWDTWSPEFVLEIQVTTELQYNIRRLLHKYYESRRVQPMPTRHSLQWDYRSPEFSASYLGHILHYVEAMIVELREKQAERTML